MSEEDIIGVVTKKLDKYLLTADDGTQYELFAKSQWETLPEDLLNENFAQFIGEKVKVTGRIIENVIWDALVRFTKEKDNLPPSLDDLLIKE